MMAPITEKITKTTAMAKIEAGKSMFSASKPSWMPAIRSWATRDMAINETPSQSLLRRSKGNGMVV